MTEPRAVFSRAASRSYQEVPYREEMEEAFGREFKQVRAYLGRGDDLRTLGATAAARGNAVVFGPSNPSRELIAHELTHVEQNQRSVPPDGRSAIVDETDRSEREASSVARRVANMLPAWPDGRLDGRHAGRKAVQPAPSAQTQSLHLNRAPDISRNGFDTFFLGTSQHSRVIALQVAKQPGDQRVTLIVASVTGGLRNPPIAERTMPLSIHRSAARTPRILRETESELPTIGHERIIDLKLSNDPNVPPVTVVLRYTKSRQWAPFPNGGSGVWKRVQVESGWLQATDGFHQMTVNFPSEIAGSFHSSRFRPWHHPGLGFGYIDSQSRRFYPYPRGRPSDVDQEIIRMGIHMIPGVGVLVMAGEALVGRDIWGRRISTTERVILGAGAVLSVIGPIFRTGKAAVSTAVAANNLARVGRLSRLQALRLVHGARSLTGPERARLAELAAKIRAGEALTSKQTTAANRIPGKMAEPQRIPAVRGEVAAVTGTMTQPGRYTDLATHTSAAETRVGRALARDLRKDVVRVQEATQRGVRTGDYVIDNAAAELYSPTSGSIDNLLRGAAKKHKQAGIMVIDMSGTKIAREEIIGSAPRLFGRPEFSDVSQLIYVEGDRVVRSVLRSRVVRSSAPGAAIRGAASAIGQNIDEE